MQIKTIMGDIFFPLPLPLPIIALNIDKKMGLNLRLSPSNLS